MDRASSARSGQVNANNVWLRIGQDGKLGFVHRDLVNGVNPVALKHC